MPVTPTIRSRMPLIGRPAGPEPARVRAEDARAAPTSDPADAGRRLERFTQGRGRGPGVREASSAQIQALYAGDQGRVPSAALDAALASTLRAVDAGRKRGLDAVELTRAAHQTAANEIARLAPAASPQDRADAAMAVGSMSILRRKDVADLSRVDSGQTQVVPYMRDLVSRMGPETDQNRFPARDAKNGGGTLEPRFSDGTNGQAYHGGFFIVAGYVAAGNLGAQSLVNAAAVFHETIDPNVFKWGGASQPDYALSMYGAAAGARLRSLRDRGDGDLIPSVTAGFMARRGTAEPQPEGRSLQRQKLAEREISSLHDMRESWVNRAIIDNNPTVNGLIGLAQRILQWRGGPLNRP